MNWHPPEWYSRDTLGVDAIVLIACVLAIAFGLAAVWIGDSM